MLLASAFRLIGFATGAALYVFLAVLVGRRRGKGARERVTLALLAAAGVWHSAGVITLFHRATTGSEQGLFIAFWQQAALAALALTPPLLWHLSVMWARLPRWMVWLGYAVAPAGWWLLRQGHGAAYGALLGLALAATAAILARAGRRAEAGFQRRFLRGLALSLAVVAVAEAAGGAGSALLVWATVAPAVWLAWFIYRYNVLELLISRRLVFALTLGLVFSLYLLLVRRLSDYVEDTFQVFGALVYLVLILAAAGIWLPLYGWINQFLSKRTQLYADFSKRLIEEAARILEVPQRVQYLAEQVGRTLELRRVLLMTSDEPPVYGRWGAGAPPDAGQDLPRLLALAREHRVELVHRSGEGPAEMRALLARLGFSYLFALMYEGKFTGLLLLDTAPRLFLDQNEAILLGLGRQISESIETCRVIEEKISLERTLVEQEHLASLGKVAATIAHEVKNPLSSIRTLVQLMGEDPQVQGRYARDLSYMLDEVDRLNRSVQQLLSFSRPLPEPEMEADVSELVRSTAEVLARQCAADQIRVEHQVESGLRLKHAAPETVKQIVLNLALNAVQASGPGGRVRVEGRAGPEGQVEIAVTDEGPGISAEVRERIFEPFFTTKQKGTGLGLAIVRKNVRHLRGEIHVESPVAQGRGTRVRVTVPAE
jgi:signal transduction histidine kinase